MFAATGRKKNLYRKKLNIDRRMGNERKNGEKAHLKIHNDQRIDSVEMLLIDNVAFIREKSWVFLSVNAPSFIALN